MDTNFPEGDSATLKIALAKPKQFTLALRRPSWAGEGFAIKINGSGVKDVSKPGSYIELKRTWRTGDTVALVLPKTLRVEGLADNKSRAALMWGPLVLAGDLGPERRGAPADPVPAFVTETRPVTEWVKPVADRPGVFRSVAVGRTIDGGEKEVDLVPFYRLHRRTYAIYWDLYTSAEWNKKLEALAAEQARQRKLEAATIAFAQPGDTEKEKSFNQQGEETTRDVSMGQPGRRGRKWFSYDLPVDAAHPSALVVTYNTDQRGKRSVEILVDGQRVGEQTIQGSPPGSATGRFFDVEYKIPADLVKDKRKITVRFQAAGGDETATVFGIRTIRADAER